MKAFSFVVFVCAILAAIMSVQAAPADLEAAASQHYGYGHQHHNSGHHSGHHSGHSPHNYGHGYGGGYGHHNHHHG